MGKMAPAALRAVVVVSVVSGLLPGATATGRAQALEDEKCFGQDPTIVGTSGDDDLRGTNGFDVISALEGDDRVRGLGGTDFLCAGAGDDRVFGGPGFDAIESSTGADEAFGEGGDDLFLEVPFPEDRQSGPVWVHVGDWSDDELHGGPGDDLFTDDGANDLLAGDDGRDTYLGIFTFNPMVIDLGTGHVTSSRGDLNTLTSIENAYGGLYGDLILGNEGPNVLGGVFGADVVYGEGGSDLLLSSVDGDVLDGGSDRYRDGVMVTGDEAVEANLSDGVVTSREPGHTPDRLFGIDDFIGSPANDSVAGSDGMNRLFGGGGDDVLEGLGGDDTITGDGPFRPWFDRARYYRSDEPVPTGADVLDGGDGRDRLDGGPARDECRSGEVVRRCESGSASTAAEPADHRSCCTVGGLDTWWAALLERSTARPWLRLVPDRLRG